MTDHTQQSRLADHAFEADSVRSGAVVGAGEGGRGLVDAIHDLLRADATAAESAPSVWLGGAYPMLARGKAWIVPLAWLPSPADGDAGALDTRRHQASKLWLDIRGAGNYHHGNYFAVDLAGAEGQLRPYADELVRTGVRRADWWTEGAYAIVLVVYGDPLPAPHRGTAVHIVPRDWVWDNWGSETMGGMPPTDLQWSWEDVVAFAQQNPSTRTADAAG